MYAVLAKHFALELPSLSKLEYPINLFRRRRKVVILFSRGEISVIFEIKSGRIVEQDVVEVGGYS